MALVSFFIILAAGLILSELFRRLHLPYTTALIVAGMAVGPFALNLLAVDPTIEFLGAIGVVFLMFIAGSEIKLKALSEIGRSVSLLAFLNAAVPFLVGFGIAQAFGFGTLTSLVLGTVFVSSSVAVIIPSLEASGLARTKVGKAIISSTVFEDIGSLLLLAFILQSFTQRTPLPLELYVPTIVLLIVGLKLLLPRLEKTYHRRKKGKDLFESELRFVVTALVATVLLFEFLGMHAIIAGFIIGLILGDSIRGKVKEKISVVSYGIFIPIFFLVIGAQTDLSVFFSPGSLALTALVVIGLMASKIASGLLGGRLMGFSFTESLLIGVSTTPQLSTTLAAAFAALAFGLLTQELIASLIILSIVTTLIAPPVMSMLVSRIRESK